MGVENRQDCKELNLEDGAVFLRFSRWRQPGKPWGNALSILVRLPPGAGLAGGDRRSLLRDNLRDAFGPGSGFFA